MQYFVPPRRSSRTEGFSVLELVVAVTVVVMLAGLMAPFFYNNKREAQAASLLATIRTLQQAVHRFAIDNGGVFPVENSGSADPADHQLFAATPSLASTWKGPYISKPLDVTANPERSKIEIRATLGAALPPGPFTLDGSALQGKGSTLVVYGISPEVAQLVDEYFDTGNSSAAAWATSGLVLYDPGEAPRPEESPVPLIGGGGSGGSGGSGGGTSGAMGMSVQLKGATLQSKPAPKLTEFSPGGSGTTSGRNSVFKVLLANQN